MAGNGIAFEVVGLAFSPFVRICPDLEWGIASEFDPIRAKLAYFLLIAGSLVARNAVVLPLEKIAPRGNLLNDKSNEYL